MNHGEKKIRDIFDTPVDQASSITQRIGEFQRNTIALLESSKSTFTREYLLTLNNEELLILIEIYRNKIQDIHRNLQEYVEYHKKNNTETPDIGLNFILVEETLTRYAEMKIINDTYMNICVILLERGNFIAP